VKSESEGEDAIPVQVNLKEAIHYLKQLQIYEE